MAKYKGIARRRLTYLLRKEARLRVMSRMLWAVRSLEGHTSNVYALRAKALGRTKCRDVNSAGGSWNYEGANTRTA
jgi:hypothetical protein